MAGFQQGKFSVVELGVARAFKKDILMLALGASGELNLNGKMAGAKLSGWVNGFTLFSLGLHGIYFWDEARNNLAIRPEVGLGLGFFSLNYGHNIVLRGGSENINRHMVSLRVLWPIAPAMSPFR
ncbi:MAG: hypothetical protein HC880_13330 [Bacteroidia bacterium]|nr:hypothetical protein [Bacteroidia bacterium]